jgi:hypothetical protein
MDTRRLSSCLGLGLALALSFGAFAAPYKWVDKEGNTHYTDKPPPAGIKSEQVDLKPLTEVSSPPPSASSDSTDPAPAPTATDDYESFRITSPADQATLRDPSAPIAISVSLVPALKGDDHIEFTLDGKVVASPIEGLERGTHHIGARVLSASGGLRITASDVTVYLHQTNVAPVTPIKPKPTPKKTP